MKFIIFLLLIITINCYCQNKPDHKDSVKGVNPVEADSIHHVIDEPDGIIRIDTLVFNKSKESDYLIKSLKNNYGVWFNKKKWSCLRGIEGEKVAVEYKFNLIGQNASGMILSEKTEMPIDNLIDAVLQYAEKAAPDTRIIRNESRRINGNRVRFIQMEGTINGTRFVYLGYYYSDKNGSIQFVTFTSKNLLKQNKSEMEALLNGFVLNEAATESRATPHKGYEKEIIINENSVIHYNKEINEAVPRQIVQLMTKNGFINPDLATEIFLDIENNTYKLKFVKEDSILNFKDVVIGFNVLELKLNTNLKFDKEIVVEFTNEDLTKPIQLPRNAIDKKTAEEIFRLKVYHIDDYHTIQYNQAMPLSEVKKIGEGVRRLKNYFPEKNKIDLIFLNKGSFYTIKMFVQKKYWDTPAILERSRSIVRYFKDSGVQKKINLMLVDFMTFEQISI